MKNPASSLALEPPTKKLKTDGNLDNVDESIVLAARNHEEWIAERRKNWPSKLRIAEKQAAKDAKQETVNQEGTTTIEEANSESKQHSNAPLKRIMCRFFLRGRCNAGSKCKFSHKRVERESRPAHERVYKRFEAPAKTSLFLKLLQSDHDAEDEQLLEFIEFLFRRNPLPQEPLQQEATAGSSGRSEE